MAGLHLDRRPLEGEGTIATLGKGIQGTGTLLLLETTLEGIWEGRGTCHLHLQYLDRLGLDLGLLLRELRRRPRT
jgi:hypothetical protein